MAANTAPIFVLTPVFGAARLTAANTALDGSGTLVTIVTGAANGTRLDRVTIQAEVTTAAGVVNLFVDDGSGTIKLVKQVLVTATTSSTTALAFSSEWVRGDTLPLLVLPSGYILKATTTIAQQFDVCAYGGNF